MGADQDLGTDPSEGKVVAEPDLADLEAEKEDEGRREPPADGSWLRAVWLLCTSTSQPTLLSLPFGIACLGWAGGVCVLLAAAVATTFCNILLARLFEYKGQRRTTYRHLARAVFKGWGYAAVLGFQFVVIIGVGITNLIVAGQSLQIVYGLYCGDSCGVRACVWQLVAGAILLVVAQLPQMGSAEFITITTTCFLVTYSTVAVVLSIIYGGGDGADYSIPGNTINRTMNAFNAIGIVVFCFTTNIVPEIMATLRPDPPGAPGTAACRYGGSYRPMRRALLAAYALITAIYLVVSLVGYWAYGNAVSDYLLNEFTHPKWLVTVIGLMCVAQLIIGEQVFEWVVYDSWEPLLVRTLPRLAFLRRRATDAGTGRTRVVPSRWCMLIVRVPYVLLLTFLAAAFPFISSVMGVIGAVGLTPLAFIVPVLLYLTVHGADLPRWSYWAHAGLAAVFTGVGLLAAIGAVRSIVVAIEDHTFFS